MHPLVSLFIFIAGVAACIVAYEAADRAIRYLWRSRHE